MATAHTPAAPPPAHVVAPGVEPLRAGQGTTFIWRKLHSLSGIVPIGAFLIEHLISNWEAFDGPVAYGKQVYWLNHLPLVRALEWIFIFIPLLYHGCYGIYIWLRGKANVVYYPWAGNWLYTSQRYTGLFLFFYIGYHVATARFMGVDLPNHPAAAFWKVQHELANPWILAFYVVAMFTVCFHFAYGSWLFAAKWGITPGVKARRRAAWVCGAGGVVLLVMGLVSIWSFVRPKYANAPENPSLSYQRTVIREQLSANRYQLSTGRSAMLVTGLSDGIRAENIG